MIPHIRRIDPNSGNKLDQMLSTQLLKKYNFGYLEVGHGKYCVRDLYEKYAERIKNFEVRHDDVWVISLPKAGTTWMQEMVWCIGNDLNFVGAQEEIQSRFPFFEHSTLFDYAKVSGEENTSVSTFLTDSFSCVEQKPSPRYIKTHFPWELLPKQITTGDKMPKIIYVARNPKDVCVSYYHHSKIFEDYSGTFEEFAELFIGNRLPYLPYWNHVRDFWKRRDISNILFVKYEDMKADLCSVIKEVSTFINKSITENEINTLVQHLTFESMRENKAVNFEGVLQTIRRLNMTKNTGNFMRSGTVASYKSVMSPEIVEKFDEWSVPYMKSYGIDF